MKNLTKIEVQQRVLQNGKPLDLNKFEWDEKTKTFSSSENDLVLDFIDIHDCIFTTSSGCTFSTGSGCTFDTSYGCTFSTGSFCTFSTSSFCTFTTGSDCTFKTGIECVIANRNLDCFEVILPKKGDIIQICPFKIKGHLVNGIHSITGKKSIIADGILSEIISKRGNVYKVKNYNQNKISYLIEIDRNNKQVYSHGDTLKEARASLIYKLADRDTSKYKNLTLKTILTKDEAIECYMTITGACGAGTKYFIDNLNKVKTKYSIKEIIDLTKGHYGNQEFHNFINNLTVN